MVARRNILASAKAPPRTILRTEPDDDWFGAYIPGAPKPAAEAYRAIVGRISLPAMHASLRLDGRTQSVGMAVAAEDWGWINCMGTHAAYRRRGGARVVLGVLAKWCRGQGAVNLYLQVEVANAAAQALYKGAGFQRLYDYHYRVLS